MVEVLFEYVKRYMNLSELDKERLREIFKSLPKDAWETGEISIDWLKKRR
jgi:hypothetical protein